MVTCSFLRRACALVLRSFSVVGCAVPLLFATSIIALDLVSYERWNVNTEKLMGHNIEMRRGETRIIEPTFLTGGVPLDLSGANTVILNYKSSDMTGAVHCVTGSVFNAIGGVARVRWTSACESTNDNYVWDMPISGASGTIIRVYGTIKMLDSVANTGDTNIAPRTYSTLDFATVQLLNVGMAPFLSSYDMTRLLDFNASVQDGRADLDVNSLNVRSNFTGSAANLSNFPAYLARTTDLYPTAVTNISMGESTLPARIDQTSPNSYVIHFPITGSQEMLTSNRLAWIVGGDTIGYVDTNGITMLKGSLQLYEEDLNCNVRAYDGSRFYPSISFYGAPDVGWYNKSYFGNYAWAFTHASNDIMYLHSGGASLAGTKVMSSYYFDTVGAYRVNGTNGGTTNFTFITSILTNGSGVVTGTVTKTMSFRGGVFLP